MLVYNYYVLSTTRVQLVVVTYMCTIVQDRGSGMEGVSETLCIPPFSKKRGHADRLPVPPCTGIQNPRHPRPRLLSRAYRNLIMGRLCSQREGGLARWQCLLQ